MKKLIITGLAIAAAFQLWAQAPELFRYQGRLVDGTNLVNATLPMSFKLYDALSGGTKLYEDSCSVLVVDGLYSTMIGDNTVYGSLTSATTNAAVYLELTVNGETLSPRERLVSVPYALNSGTDAQQQTQIGSLGYVTVPFSTTLNKIYSYQTNGLILACATNADLCSGILGFGTGTNTLQTGGILTSNNAFVVGAKYYLSATAGEITQTQPTNSGYIVRSVGCGITTNTMSINISTVAIELN